MGIRTAKPKDNEILRIKDNDIFIIVYNSMNVVYKDNTATYNVINSILIQNRIYDYELGSDEAGKGEWYGPLVVVCIALTSEQMNRLRMLGVNDSKALNRNRLERIAEAIIKEGFIWEKIILKPEKYNQLIEEFKKENKSLNNLLAWLHSKVIRNALSRLRSYKLRITIDKFDEMALSRRLADIEKKIDVIQKSEGESEIPVAAASILAKYIFEKEVDRLCKEYDIDLRSITPTDIHKDALQYVAKVHFKNIQNINGIR